jgi:hypothetical protein
MLTVIVFPLLLKIITKPKHMGKKFPNNYSDGLEFYTCYGGNVRCNNEEYEPPVVITTGGSYS